MRKELVFSESARAALKRGAELLAKAVSVTLGPNGRGVLLQQGSGRPLLTRDGATVAKSVVAESRFANIGLKLIREAAERTAEQVGDGTTTTTVLGFAILREGLKFIEGGADPSRLRRGIEYGVRVAVRYLERAAIPATDGDRFDATTAEFIEESPDPTLGLLAARMSIRNLPAGLSDHMVTFQAPTPPHFWIEGLRAGIESAVLEQLADEATLEAGRRLMEVESRLPFSRDVLVGIATASANQDTGAGEVIAEAIERVGRDGIITVEAGDSVETTVRYVDGIQFSGGYLSPYFVTGASDADENNKADLAKPRILIYEGRISSAQELLPLLEKVAEERSPLLIIAEDVQGEALTTLVVNKLRGNLPVCAVKAPGFIEEERSALMRDIAAVTGGHVISAELGRKLEKTKLSDLGTAQRVMVEKDLTTIIEGGGVIEEIDSRVRGIRAAIRRSKSERERQALKRRLAGLTGGVAIIDVGATTETEARERKARIEDAVRATRAAVEEGILPGGGVALLRAQYALRDLSVEDEYHRFGIMIIQRALEEPLRLIAYNAGLEGGSVVEKVREGDSWAYGFNADARIYEDLVAAGVLDATSVTCAALQNAASIAGLLLETEVVITEARPREEDPVPMQ
jgi:chaperonin GroEL